MRKIALALERVHYVNIAQDVLVSMEAERLHNTLLSTIFHDLRTPLTAIVAGLLEGEIMAPLTYDCNTTATVFNTWLEQCLIPVLLPNCIIVLDDAHFHKSVRTLEIIEKHGYQ